MPARVLVGVRRTGAVVAVLVVLLSSSLAVLERRLWRSVEVERELIRLVGEIRRLDDVLTMSARLFAARGEAEDRARYQEEAEALDAALARALSLARSTREREAFAATEAANRALVAIEEAAFASCEAGDCRSAEASLRSEAYTISKKRYAAGMDAALGLLASRATADIELFRLAQLAPLGFAVLVAITYALLRWKIRAAELAAQRRAAQTEALRVTITTVLDIVNNALNNLQLFRMKADESNTLAPDELALFDQIIDETSRRLRELGEMKEFRSRRIGSFEVLDSSAAAHRPEARQASDG